MRSHDAPTAPDLLNDAPGAEDVLLVVTGDDAKTQLLEWAAQRLPEGECLVEAPALAGEKRAFTTTPLHPSAQAVAATPPTLVRGRLLERKVYYRVPADERDAHEHHYENGKLVESRKIHLQPLAQGQAPRRTPTKPASPKLRLRKP